MSQELLKGSVSKEPEMANLAMPTCSIADYVSGEFESIGRGACGIVYSGKARSAGDLECAFKVCAKDVSLDGHREISKDICNEVSIHYNLDHPSIVQLYDYFQDKDHVVLVMELCHNRSIEDYLKQTVLTELQVRRILRQIVEGLIYLHSRNIVHRDLKLGNILLTSNMDAKISDFGLAMQLEGDRKCVSVCGTPAYMAPEVVFGDSVYGKECDLWSLGCIVYEMIVGKLPFGVNGVKATPDFEIPSDIAIPFGARDLIVSLLKTDPSDRPSLRRVLEHPYFGVLPNTAVTAEIGAVTQTLQSMVPRPLNTTRLKPYTHSKGRVYCSITYTGEVLLVRQNRNGKKSERLIVSGDGWKISVMVLQVNKSGLSESYTYSNLPHQYWKRYAYMARFVSLIQSKTPKVIKRGEYAKLVLMENGNFEASFYDGAKVIITSSDQRAKFVSADKGVEHEYSLSDTVPPSIYLYHQKAVEGHSQCLEIECCFNACETSTTEPVKVFPITIGRRPRCPKFIHDLVSS